MTPSPISGGARQQVQHPPEGRTDLYVVRHVARQDRDSDILCERRLLAPVKGAVRLAGTGRRRFVRELVIRSHMSTPQEPWRRSCDGECKHRTAHLPLICGYDPDYGPDPELPEEGVAHACPVHRDAYACVGAGLPGEAARGEHIRRRASRLALGDPHRCLAARSQDG